MKKYIFKGEFANAIIELEEENLAHAITGAFIDDEDEEDEDAVQLLENIDYLWGNYRRVF